MMMPAINKIIPRPMRIIPVILFMFELRIGLNFRYSVKYLEGKTKKEVFV
ncbi:hypothetical protein GCM10023183_35800 [Nibribacter koreensis]|uniref:Uncharacterized protein n=1 Tax=Nibribacter koreensis TaxID=1084519 RepID=A0ABP8G1C3_9BACT